MQEPTSSYSRRRFAACVAASPLAAGLPSRAGGQVVGLRETADLITGPFYPVVKPADRDVDLTLIRGHRRRAAGQVVRLSGRVLNVSGEPVRDAAMEIWQADARGRYAHPSDPNTEVPLDPDFQGYALLRTDKDGRYQLTTIKPGPYKTPRGDMRAPHIHFQVDGRTDRKVTQLFFPRERFNEQDRHLNSVRRPETLIATVDSSSTDTYLVALWDIVLTQG